MKKNILLLCTSIAMLFLLMACADDNKPKQETEKSTDEQTEDTEQEEENKEIEAGLPDTPLQKGDESAEVESLQKSLNDIGYEVELSGKFDDLTTWALTDIQLQDEDLQVTGMYEKDTKASLQEILDGNASINTGKELTKPKQPDKYPDEVENPYDVLSIANKNHALPDDYIPSDLTVPDIRFPFEEDVPKKQMRAVAADAIEDLFAAGDEDGVNLFGQSGYRSYDRQVALFDSYSEQHGEEQANTYSARPGESEHQTGLVMDVTSEEVGFDLNTDFGTTAEGEWLKDHAHEYGFIIRYPEDKVDITQYQYEPWHIRYVGKKAATEIYENNETLEEYFGVE